MNDTKTLLSMLKLKLNIEHPDVEESYVYGYEAGQAGIAEEDNPFHEMTRENELWSEGWWAGFYGAEPAFSLGSIAESEMAQNPLAAANDHAFHDGKGGLFVKVLEITSVIGVAALVGYQMLELVA